MGEAADAVQSHLREYLAASRPAFDWRTEYAVGATPVDIGGEGEDALVLVELEWRRADPADNTAKLFRHLVEGTLPTDRVAVFQVFTGYYELASGGVSSKRRNAEFVGDRVARTFDGVSYDAVTVDIEPPTRDRGMPDGWRSVVDDAGRTIVAVLEKFG